jgi:ABC-type microcin C transport system duplicated ATPase subunit YejF
VSILDEIDRLHLAFPFEPQPPELSAEDLAEVNRIAVQGSSLGFGSIDYLADAMQRTITAYAVRDERRLTRYRLAWSGPDKLQRQIARAYGLPVMLLLPTPPSALDARYRRRQINRRRRRK